MSRQIRAVALVATSVALLGCMTDTEIVGRYDHAHCLTVSPGPGDTTVTSDPASCSSKRPELTAAATMLSAAEAAQLNATTPAAATPAAVEGKPKKGIDLPERALKSYIEVNTKLSEANAKSLREKLAAPIGTEQADASTKDFTTLSGTLAITLAQAGAFNPADRVERATVKITPKDGAKIKSWIAAKTVYDSISQGGLTSSETSTAELSPNAGALAGIPGLGTGKLSNTRVQGQTLTVTQRVEDITPAIDYEHGTLTVTRQGGLGRDVAGNTFVTLTLTPKDIAQRELFSIKAFRRNGKWLDPAAVEVGSQTMIVPVGAKTIGATLELTYTIRHIVDGDDTYQDADDFVEWITVTRPPASLTLVTEDRFANFIAGYRGSTFGLVATTGPNPGTYLFAHDNVDGAKDRTFCLSSYQTAEELRRYLNRPNVSPGDAATIGGLEVGIVRAGTDGSPTFQPIDRSIARGLEVRANCFPK